MGLSSNHTLFKVLAAIGFGFWALVCKQTSDCRNQKIYSSVQQLPLHQQSFDCVDTEEVAVFMSAVMDVEWTLGVEILIAPCCLLFVC